MVGPTGLLRHLRIAGTQHPLLQYFVKPACSQVVRFRKRLGHVASSEETSVSHVPIKNANKLTFFFMVGPTGFEPATPSPPAKCATRLRYGPTHKNANDGLGVFGVKPLRLVRYRDS